MTTNDETVGHAQAASAEEEIRTLYRRALEGWNARDAAAMAGAFAENGESIGFDGSVVTGRAEIEQHLRQIFADHETAAYVAKVRSVRLLAEEVGLLRAVAGMIPPGKTNLNPAVNAVQTVIATRRDGAWQIAQFQNTPAQFHGRPELAQELTDELRRESAARKAAPGGREPPGAEAVRQDKGAFDGSWAAADDRTGDRHRAGLVPE